MDQDLKNTNSPSSFSTLRNVISYLSQKRKKELIIVLLLSILSSIAESVSIAALVPFISFIINPETYFFNYFLNEIFIFLIFTIKKIYWQLYLLFLFLLF